MALKYYEQSLNLSRELLDGENCSSVTSYNNIAAVYNKLRHPSIALNCLKKSLGIQLKLVG